jgi:sigma-B regulation protein RsbU (phosphoserine phosphatase)
MNRRFFAFAVMLAVNLIGTGTVCYLTYVERRASYNEDVTALLRAAAAFGEHVARVDLPEAPITTTPAPHDALWTKYFTDFERATAGANLYTVIEDDQGQIFYTESSMDFAHVGQKYLEPPDKLREAFLTKHPTDGTYANEFGRWHAIFTPVQSPSGQWFVIGATIATEKVERGIVARLRSTLAIGAGAFVLMSLIGAFFLSKMVRRTAALVDVMEDFVKAGFKRESGVHARLTEIVKAQEDDVAIVARAVERMEVALDGYIDQLTATTAAKERIESELSVAKDIQLGLLPKLFPPYPNRPEFELFALIKSAKEVGGDLYDFFWVDEHHLFFVIGDVSDKGVPAALYMAVTKTLLKTNVRDPGRLAEALARVNDYLVEGNDSMMFVTLFAAIVDVRTGELEYCDGGHNPPYLLRRDGRAHLVEKRTGMALGFSPGFVFETAKIKLERGDTIFLYTDGVTEAMNAGHDQFSEQRLEPALGELVKQPLDKLLPAVMSRVSAFAAGAPQSDDITMLALRYIGEPRHAEATETAAGTADDVATAS